MQQLSKAGAEFIASWEGFRGEPYNDQAGHATIGYGHLLHRGNVRPVEKSIRWSKERALVQLRRDAGVAERCVRDNVKVKLTQDQFDALVSFVFNLGCGAFRGSTLLKGLNRGNYERVPAELMKWVLAGGRPSLGLQRRRAQEGHVFSRKAKRTKPLRAKGSIAGTHFTWAEARSHDGKWVPLHLRPNAIRHAKNMEKLRAQINVVRARRGLKPTGINTISWYRSPTQNTKVGGARASRHMKADATDISKEEIARLLPFKGGKEIFEAITNTVFAHGGFGQYPGGNRHTDSRGFWARWTSWTR